MALKWQVFLCYCHKLKSSSPPPPFPHKPPTRRQSPFHSMALTWTNEEVVAQIIKELPTKKSKNAGTLKKIYLSMNYTEMM